MSQWAKAGVTMCVELGAPGPGLRIDYVRTGDGFAVPRRFEAHFSSPAEPLKTLRMTIGVSSDGVPECAEVVISCEPGAPALTRTDLEVPLRRLMDQAVSWIARPAEFDAVGNVVRLGARSSLRDAAVSAAPSPRRAQRSLTPEFLAQVAETYKEAKAVPRSKRFGRPRPTQAVAEKYTADVYSTAAKWVAKARDAGLLEGGRKARTPAASVRFSTEAPEKHRDEPAGATAKSPFVQSEEASK
jgi:transposase-like protein